MAQSWAPFPAFVVDAQQQELDCPWIDGGHFSELKIRELKIALQKNLTKISAKIPGFESRTTELNNIILDEFSKKRYEFNALQAEFTALEYDLHCVRTNRETGHNVNGHLERVRHRYMVLYVKMWQMIVAIERTSSIHFCTWLQNATLSRLRTVTNLQAPPARIRRSTISCEPSTPRRTVTLAKVPCKSVKMSARMPTKSVRLLHL